MICLASGLAEFLTSIISVFVNMGPGECGFQQLTLHGIRQFRRYGTGYHTFFVHIRLPKEEETQKWRVYVWESSCHTFFFVFFFSETGGTLHSEVQSIWQRTYLYPRVPTITSTKALKLLKIYISFFFLHWCCMRSSMNKEGAKRLGTAMSRILVLWKKKRKNEMKDGMNSTNSSFPSIWCQWD